MRIFSKIGLGILFCSLLLDSCGGVTPVPILTSTAAATNTIFVTNSPEPSITPTYSPAEKIFTLPTQELRLIDTPTPIAIPNFDNSSVSLKEMSENDFLDFIDWLNQYSYQNFPSLGDWWTDGQFIGSQQPVALAIQEYLYRFPKSPEAERLKWQLAFINSMDYLGLPGNQYGDDWMIAELQNRLNKGEIQPNQLENVLGKYWFDIAYFQPIENLFNDGKTGWLYTIVPQVWEEEEITTNQGYSSHGGLFVVVRETAENEYRILLLNSAWDFSFDESSVFSVDDHNRNGTPEIALYIGAHSGTMCGGNLLIYEWQSSSFDELTKNSISLSDCGESFEYSEVNSDPTIVFHGAPSLDEVYVWNGKAYEFSQYTGMTSFELWKSGKSGFSYEVEAEMLKNALASGDMENFGPGYPDYLRFRLGVDYAFLSKPKEAIDVFQELISSPFDKSRDLFPSMARTFINEYTGNANVYKACRRSLGTFEKALDPYRDSNGYVDTNQRQSIFGFTFTSFDLYVFPLCDDDKAFSMLANLLPSITNDLPNELRKNAVDINYAKKMDINLDGMTEEWIIAFDTDHLFLVFPDTSHFQAKKLNISVEISKSNASSFQIAVERWGNFLNPVMIIQFNQDFTLLDVGDNFETKRLFDEFHVANYVISNQDTEPELQLFYTNPQNPYYPDRPWNGYRWDPTQRAFRDDLLEYNLFVLHDPEKSLDMVDNVFPLLEEWKNIPDASTWSLPHTYYISGLSYELSGNRQKAAQIYWQLWHDFPESSYALMARYKLEPVSP